MEESRRRQLHSCDPCRKGKRGCDAPVCSHVSGHQRPPLTLILRKTAKRAHSVLARTARDGKRNAHSIGSPQSAWTQEGVDESKPTPQTQLSQALMTKLLRRYCALHNRILPILGNCLNCLVPLKPQITPRHHHLRTRKITFWSHPKSTTQAMTSRNFSHGR